MLLRQCYLIHHESKYVTKFPIDGGDILVFSMIKAVVKSLCLVFFIAAKIVAEPVSRTFSSQFRRLEWLEILSWSWWWWWL